MRLVPALRLRFAQIQTDRSGRTLNLACQRVFFIRWKVLRQSKDLHRELVR
jgi:hypothetical protein